MFEFTEVCKTISAAIGETDDYNMAVKRVLGPREFEVERITVPAMPHNIVPRSERWTTERSAKLLLRFKFGGNCDGHVRRLAFALGELLESGISLQHEGGRVVSIVAINDMAFDVTDLVGKYDFVLRSSRSVEHITSYSTHGTLDVLRKLGSDAQTFFGQVAPSRRSDYSHAVEILGKDNCAPHWWLAAIVDPPEGKATGGRMVHVDLCGAAYDESSIILHNSKLISFQSFETPEFEFVTPLKAQQDPKFMLRPLAQIPMAGIGPSGVYETSSLQKIRHMRHVLHDDWFWIEASPLDSFLSRQVLRDEHGTLSDGFKRRVTEIVEEYLIHLPPGTKVKLKNLRKRPELNGCWGIVAEQIEEVQERERIPVSMEGQLGLLTLRPNCVVVHTERPLFLHAEIETARRVLKELEPSDRITMFRMSPSNRAVAINAIARDDDVNHAREVIRSNPHVSITWFAEEKFLSGMRRLLSPPLRELFPNEERKLLDACMEIVDHARSKEVFGILERFQHLPKGADDGEQVLENFDAEVPIDDELSKLFEKMQDLGVYSLHSNDHLPGLRPI